MNHKTTPIHASIALSLALWAGPSFAETLTVGRPNTNCAGARYDRIAAAIESAKPGDIIEVCPAIYEEQLLITKPLTLRGVPSNGYNRVVIRPARFTYSGAVASTAVISVLNTQDVTIENLTLDAGENTVDSCDFILAGVRVQNSSATIQHNAFTGTALKNPPSCAVLFPGNGNAIHVDATQPGSFTVAVKHNSIREFARNGILVMGTGITANVESNTITGIGPSTGSFQFGIFIANGAVANVRWNMVSQGNCGGLEFVPCRDLRSEGVILRAVGSGTVVDGNIFTNAQNGIFINGGSNLRITNNLIRNMDVWSGIHLQATTDSVFSGNQIYNTSPMNEIASERSEGCGINEVVGMQNARNRYFDNVVIDAYCGIAHVSTSTVESGTFVNTIYTTINSDQHPTRYPPATLPK